MIGVQVTLGIVGRDLIWNSSFFVVVYKLGDAGCLAGRTLPERDVQSNPCFIVSVVRGQECDRASSELQRPYESHRQASCSDSKGHRKGVVVL